MSAPAQKSTLSSADNSSSSSVRNSLVLIVAVAFVLRILVILLGHTYRITPRRDHFQFGWEMGRLARSIALGQGFGSPTDLFTGLSAWAPPVYPYILAGIFKIFGIYTSASAFAILTFNSLFAALTCLTVYGIGFQMYGRRVAIAAAWTWAVFPYVIYWPVRVVWETSLSTFLLSLAVYLTLRIRQKPSRALWIIFGILWGLILLTNTALVSMLPFFLFWILYRKFTAEHFAGAVLCVAIACTVASPWIVRNYVVFHKFIFVRDNLPLELHVANNDASSALWTRTEHPGNDPEAMREFQTLGEIRFMEEKRQQVLQFVHDHPSTFFKFTVERIGYFWAAPPQFLVTRNGYDLGYARHMGFLLGALFAFAGLWLTIRNRIRGTVLDGLSAVRLSAALLSGYPIPALQSSHRA